MQELRWLYLLVTTWGVLYLSTDKERFGAFWTGGLWSIAFAALGEGLIRSDVGYFVPEHLLLPVLGTDALNFLGPRFVEGVLFMQTLRPERQLRRVALWIGAVVGSEVAMGLAGTVALSLSGIGLALAVHTLRFMSLLGVHSARNFGARRQAIVQARQRRQTIATLLWASRIGWPVSWPLFAALSAGLIKAAKALNSR